MSEIPSNELDNSTSSSQPAIEFTTAVQYVAKVKARFKDQPQIYNEFLSILHDFHSRRAIDEVYNRIQDLFSNHPDLFDEFKYFLPRNTTHADDHQPNNSR
jgi:paired amphipathic helix protein Sin3a